jgi:hypothetical protein
MCCCCFSLKTGIIILGIWESIWMLITLGSMIGAFVLQETYAYNILPIFIKPILVDLPKVLAFFILLCGNFRLSTRRLYYCIRGFSLAMLVICSVAQIISSWAIILGDYRPEYCNARGNKNSE